MEIKKKVLIIDDYKGTTKSLAALFRIYNFEVLTYFSSDLFFEELSSKKFVPEFDYVLLDILINSDKLDGIDVYHLLKKYNPECVVLFITGCDLDFECTKKALTLAPVIFKEFNTKELILDIKNGTYDEYTIENYDESKINKINNLEHLFEDSSSLNFDKFLNKKVVVC